MEAAESTFFVYFGDNLKNGPLKINLKICETNFKNVQVLKKPTWKTYTWKWRKRQRYQQKCNFKKAKRQRYQLQNGQKSMPTMQTSKSAKIKLKNPKFNCSKNTQKPYPSTSCSTGTLQTKRQSWKTTICNGKQQQATIEKKGKTWKISTWERVIDRRSLIMFVTLWAGKIRTSLLA